MSSAATSRLVVGDRFRDFAEAVGAETFSGLARSLDAGDLDALQGPVRVVTGQGVGEFEISYLRDAITRRQLDEHIVLVHSTRRARTPTGTAQGTRGQRSGRRPHADRRQYVRGSTAVA